METPTNTRLGDWLKKSKDAANKIKDKAIGMITKDNKAAQDAETEEIIKHEPKAIQDLAREIFIHNATDLTPEECRQKAKEFLEKS